MHFCVFSFNRGRFLRNCIDSIERCFPGAMVTIFDDDSDDPDTRQVLDSLAAKYRVEQPGSGSTHRLGGLYDNMQAALDICGGQGTLCFLQDDTQLVRPILQEDLEDIEWAFESTPYLGFLSPCFVRGRTLNRGAEFDYDSSRNLYFRKPDKRSSGCHFSALLITKPSRLRQVSWRFEESEPENDRQAARLFGPMGYLQAPFAMWLPEVPAYRGKKKTLGLKLAERKRRCGFYPFELMTEGEVAELRKRDGKSPPKAEDYLRCTPRGPPKPWAYNPLTDTGWIKLLNQVEIGIRRLFRS